MKRECRGFIPVILLVSILIVVQFYFLVFKSSPGILRNDLLGCEIQGPIAPIGAIPLENKKPKVCILYFDDTVEKYAVVSELPSVPDKYSTRTMDPDLPFVDMICYQRDGPDIFTTMQRDNLSIMKGYNARKLFLLLNFENSNIDIERVQHAFNIINNLAIMLNDSKKYPLEKYQLKALEEFTITKDKINESASIIRNNLMRLYWDSQLKYIFVQKSKKKKMGEKLETTPVREHLKRALEALEKRKEKIPGGKAQTGPPLRKNMKVQAIVEDELELDNGAYLENKWNISTLVWGICEIEKNENYRLSPHQVKKIYPILFEIQNLSSMVEKMKKLKKKMFSEEQIKYLRAQLIHRKELR